MIELSEAVRSLCDELGIPVPSPDGQGTFRLQVEQTPLSLSPKRNRPAVLSLPIGKVRDLAENRGQSVRDLLCYCLNLNGARLHAQGVSESLSYERNTGALFLWRYLDLQTASMREFFESVESLLNEAEFWRGHLGAA